MKPQTIEAIVYSLIASIPLIVYLSKTIGA